MNPRITDLEAALRTLRERIILGWSNRSMIDLIDAALEAEPETDDTPTPRLGKVENAYELEERA